MRQRPAEAAVAPGDRIPALDVLRGFALLGILLVNVLGFALPFWAMYDPAVYGGESGADSLSWALMEIFVHGSMFALFSMLFGAGIVLLTDRIAADRRASRVRTIYFRRNIVLIAFGLIHAYLMVMPGDILYAYGVTALLLFPLRRIGARRLIAISASILLTQTALDLVEYREANALHSQALEDPAGDAGERWAVFESEFRVPAGLVEQDIAAHRGSYRDLFEWYVPVNFENQTAGFLASEFWNVASMMLLGMALFKLDVLTAGRSARFYATMAVAGYTIGSGVRALLVWRAIGSGFDTHSMLAMRADSFLRVPVMLGHAGVVLLVCRLGLLSWLRGRLAAVGRMALTNYFMQTLIMITIFSGVGFAQFARFSRAELYLFVVAVWVVQIGWSRWWLRRFRSGPAEWIWRCLTYGRRVPFRLERTGG